MCGGKGGGRGVGGGGVGGGAEVAQTTWLHMKRLNKPCLRLSFFYVFFVCKCNL